MQHHRMKPARPAACTALTYDGQHFQSVCLRRFEQQNYETLLQVVLPLRTGADDSLMAGLLARYARVLLVLHRYGAAQTGRRASRPSSSPSLTSLLATRASLMHAPG